MCGCNCRDVSEEERAATVWDAPFALIVHDDSRMAALEYANKQVGRIGCGGLAGNPVHHIVRCIQPLVACPTTVRRLKKVDLPVVL